MDKLWPITARAADDGELWLGGCAASTLAAEFGTPLYIFDEATLRTQARAYREALAQQYPGTAQAAYASKAYLCTAIAQLFAEEGLDLDVVSGGELYVALRAGFPPERIHFHGNNKSREELTEALAAGIGRIVVDNFHELAMLAELVAGEQPASGSQLPVSSFELPVRVWLRLSPGVAAHTHAHIQTGHLDTKFGFPIATGDAERAVSLAMQTPGLELIGLHCHIGSQIYEPESLADAAAVLIAFAAEMRDRHGFTLRELQSRRRLGRADDRRRSRGAGGTVHRRAVCSHRRHLPGARPGRCRTWCWSRAVRSSRPPRWRYTPSARARRSPACAPTSR